MKEVWKDVVGYAGLYKVSDRGRVKSVARTLIYRDGRRKPVRGRVMRMEASRGGYYSVGLHKDDVQVTCHVHRLVCAAFFGVRKGSQVNHKDGNKLNNKLCNLEYCTASENQKHSARVLGNINNKRPIKDITTGKIYGTIREACAALNYRNEKCFKRYRHNINGHQFEYV